MKIPDFHPWTCNIQAAIDLQKRLAGQVRLQATAVENIRLAAGADVSSTRFGSRLYAAVVIWSLAEGRVVEEAFAEAQTDFPYLPGLLSFRELPVVLEAFRQLKQIPCAVLADGQGIAHPRRLGLASHLGLWLNLPTVGCAKTRLVGQAPDPGPDPGDWEPLIYKGETVGLVLRTRSKSRPLYISPGHLMDLESALKLTLACQRKARLPEPTRLAHLAVNAFRRSREPV
jgi:deoxyribonuclease V